MILIIDCGSKKTKNIAEILSKTGFKNKTIQMGSDIPSDISGIIISGSPILLTEKDHSYKFEFIKNLDIPVLGICFGHQIIGLLYGSKIQTGERIKGEQEIELVKNDILFSGLNNSCSFVEDHKEYIDVPKDFDLLAKSRSCDVEAIKHKTKRIYGVQFHPEVSGENGKKLLINFCNMC